MKIDKSGKTAYRCKTKKLANQFMKECETIGISVVGAYKPDNFPNSDFKHFVWVIDEGKIRCAYDYSMFVETQVKTIVEYEGEQPIVVMHLIRGNKTIVKLSNGKVGVAKCSPEDEFDVYEGLRIATARAYGKEPLEVKEVSRAPRKGEYIKFINPDPVSVAYGFQENQIVQIKGVDIGGPWVTTATNRDMYLFPNEYVVLENYKPKK